MKTLERPVEAPQAPTIERRRFWILALVALVALALGALGGWVLRGDSGSDATAVVAGGGELTPRQEEMLAVYDDAVAAARANDVETSRTLFSPTAEVQWLGESMTFDEYLRNIEVESWSTLDYLEPVLVNGNELVAMHRYSGGLYGDVFEFTTDGDVLITRFVIE